MPQTIRGRVVYDRPTHYFTYQDVLRIIRKVDFARTPKEKRLEEAGAAGAAVLAAFADFLRAIKHLDAPLRVDLIGDIALGLTAGWIEMMALLPETAGRILQELRNLLRRI